MNHRSKISQEESDTLISNLLGIYSEFVVAKCEGMKGAHVSFGWLKHIFEEYRTKEKKITLVDGKEAGKDDHQTYCICAYLLYLLGCTIFTDKSNKSIEEVFIELLRDLSIVGEWS